MPPIQVHIDDPITPKKEAQAAPAPQQSSPYPPAQPGAAAVPAPTPYAPIPQAQPPPTRTAPPTSDYGSSPPPPQPGAVPVPSNQQFVAPATNLPPPPKAGEKPPPPTTTMPPQMGIPPPQANYAPTHTTTTSYTSPAERGGAGPTTLNFGAAPQPIPAAAAHPPGYQQNLQAQEMSSAQRASLDAQERRTEGAGFGGFGGGGENSSGEMWNAVKGWMGKAGETLAETEKEVWKRINGGSS